jgi:fructose-bisphosphate aldolase class II
LIETDRYSFGSIKIHAFGAESVPMVLHGSSGVSDEQLRAAVAAGLRKINGGSALNIAFTGAVRTTLASQESPDPRKYLLPAREAMTATVQHLLTLVG